VSQYIEHGFVCRELSSWRQNAREASGQGDTLRYEMDRSG
jgi:hypothetical protein